MRLGFVKKSENLMLQLNLILIAFSFYYNDQSFTTAL